MPRCGRPARRAVSRPVCANEKNPALSVDRKPLGTSKRASHPARPVPAFAPHGPRCSADACRSAIGRPILKCVDRYGSAMAATSHAGMPHSESEGPGRAAASRRRLQHRGIGCERRRRFAASCGEPGRNLAIRSTFPSRWQSPGYRQNIPVDRLGSKVPWCSRGLTPSSEPALGSPFAYGSNQRSR